jgi:oligopeptide transport system permease protein
VGRYIARRLLQMIPVIIGTTLIIFTLAWGLPGDRFAGRCGQRPCPRAFVEAETARLHLDEALPLQYAHFVINMLRGDFGMLSNGDTVLEAMGRAWPVTIKLTLVALAFEIILGIGVGALAAFRRGGWFDNATLFSSLIAISLPTFVIGYVFQYVLGVQLGFFRVTVRSGAPWADLIMPGFILAALSLAFVLRLTRATVLETMSADHVRTAVAKGLPRSLVIRRHIVRNSLIPVITYVGADVGILLGGAIVTEGIFNIQGIGGLLFRATQFRETSTVVSVCTVLVLIVLLVNLLVDLLYAVLDPRIRYE